MPIAQFKEKTYESYFGKELARFSSFAPDQVDEYFLGFDEAFFLPWLSRGRRFGLWRTMPGISLHELNYIAQDISDHLPPFRLNFFVQYKRPEFVVGPRGKQRSEWGCPYYRYAINQNQQKTLEKLHINTKGRAAVLYAAPAFWTNQSLFDFAGRKAIIDNSNVASADRLINHKCYTYIAPGNIGKAHSKTENIESPRLEEIYKNRREEGLPFKKHIIETAKIIQESVGERSLHMHFVSAKKALFAQFKLDETTREDSNKFVSSLITIEAFCQVYDVSFYPVP
jgi:hypothetical protein